MTSHLRIILLVLTLAYSLVFGPGSVFAGGEKAHKVKAHRMRAHRVKTHHVKVKHVLSAPKPLGVRAVKYARHLLGVPYRYGGGTPGSGFDCSGFVSYVYNHFGVKLPHSSYADFDLGKRVSRESLHPGDLVFFDGVGHVGMYIGGGRFIHAPHSGLSVQINTLSDGWYAARYDGARRLVVHHAARVKRSLPLLGVG
ncbi:MAG: C40 family peptidase [Actinomycetes bacterium]